MIISSVKTKIGEIDFLSQEKYIFSQISLTSNLSIELLSDSRHLDGNTSGLYCMYKKKSIILKSIDNGTSWIEVFWAPKDCKILRLFVGLEYLVVQLADPLRTILVSGTGDIIEELDGPVHPWHGSQGIGQNNLGTVIFGEYPRLDNGRMLSLWRHSLEGSVSPTLTLLSGRRPPDGFLRHFHTCFPDDFIDGVWYASSGDILEHNRLWTSEDDGRSWSEPKIECRNSYEYNITSVERLLRFTSAVILGPRHMIWATDDGLGIESSAVVEAKICRDKISLNILSALSGNYFRSAIDWDDKILFISESKNDITSVNFALYDKKHKYVKIASTKNTLGISSPVTNSIASIKQIDNMAFIPSLGVIFTSDKGTIVCVESNLN